MPKNGLQVIKHHCCWQIYRNRCRPRTTEKGEELEKIKENNKKEAESPCPYQPFWLSQEFSTRVYRQTWNIPRQGTIQQYIEYFWGLMPSFYGSWQKGFIDLLRTLKINTK